MKTLPLENKTTKDVIVWYKPDLYVFRQNSGITLGFCLSLAVPGLQPVQAAGGAGRGACIIVANGGQREQLCVPTWLFRRCYEFSGPTGSHLDDTTTELGYRKVQI
jgi:hypothetical protein